MTVYILGGGPTGLAVVDGLIESDGDRFVLIERGPRLGGLAQTVEWKGIGHHDLGPHKIFTLDPAIQARVEALLSPSEWLTRDKVSAIYMKGHFLPYPPSPLSLVGVFGLQKFARMVWGYGAARLAAIVSRKEPQTFEGDLVGRLGRGLYEVLFKPIAIKLWGDPRTLDVKLSRGRVQTPSLVEVVGRMLGVRKTSEFEALTFRYPVGGLGRLWEAIAKKAQARGRILCNHTVTDVEVRNGRVVALDCASNETGARVRFDIADGDYVVSTLPLGAMARLLESHLESSLRGVAQRVVTLNDLLLVFLHIDRQQLMPESWVFVPDPDIAFHRVSEQESFDPGMTPRGSIVCCEIMSNDMRRMDARTDEDLIAEAAKGLGRMGYQGFEVLASKVVRLPRSYPVFHAGFESELDRLLAAFDAFENFRTIGRQGAFNYIGTLDAMDIGYGFARWHSGRDARRWSEERVRTSHYPVLD